MTGDRPVYPSRRVALMLVAGLVLVTVALAAALYLDTVA